MANPALKIEDLPSITSKKLNLGSGEVYKDGYVNLDWNTVAKADVYHNLNLLPYPFEDNTFDEIIAHHILEHLDRPFQVMKELHRILKPNGILHIQVPHFSRGFTHAEHAHGFDISFPKYFDKNFTKSGFFGVEFELKKMELHWLAFFDLLPYYGYSPFVIRLLGMVNNFISALANFNIHLCSRIWCYWVGGFDEIEFVFSPVKASSSVKVLEDQ